MFNSFLYVYQRVNHQNPRRTHIFPWFFPIQELPGHLGQRFALPGDLYGLLAGAGHRLERRARPATPAGRGFISTDQLMFFFHFLVINLLISHFGWFF